MKMNRTFYKRLFSFFFLVTASFNAVAGYVMYGHLEGSNIPLNQNYRVTVNVGGLDWDDPRPLDCIKSYVSSSCTLRFEMSPEGQGGRASFFVIQSTFANKVTLVNAGVETVGQYFRYLRNNGINILTDYEWQDSFKFQGNVSYFSICLQVQSFQHKQQLACSNRGMVVQPGCDIRESQLSLDHGALSANRVNGHVASADLTISCDSWGSAWLMAPNPVSKLPLTPDGSLFTTISAGGNPCLKG